MNRRTFLQRFGIGVSAIAATAVLPANLFTQAKPTPQDFNGPLTFKGIPVEFDRDCPKNRIYSYGTWHAEPTVRYYRIKYSDIYPSGRPA